MIDSLLFLPDVDVVTLDASTLDAAADHVPCDDAGDAAAAAAVAASRDGHAHAARAAWVPALAALERSAVARDTLVRDGLAGPLVAARGWSDLATVYAASGDLAAARRAQAQAAGAAADATLPADLGAALDELHTMLGPVTPLTLVPSEHSAPARAADEPEATMMGDLAGGLLWLDTTELDAADDVTPATAPAVATRMRSIEAAVGEPERGAIPETPQRPTSARIAAVDAAVALAGGDDTTTPAAGGLGSRLRRLLRR